MTTAEAVEKVCTAAEQRADVDLFNAVDLVRSLISTPVSNQGATQFSIVYIDHHADGRMRELRLRERRPDGRVLIHSCDAKGMRTHSRQD